MQVLEQWSQQVGSGITSAIQGVRSHGVATGGAINKAVYAATQTQASIARAGSFPLRKLNVLMQMHQQV